MLENVVDLLVVSNHVEVCLISSEHIVELSDELLDSRDELDKTFWYEYNTIVETEVCTIGNNLCDVCYDIVESLVLSLYLLTDEGDVRVSLKSALESNVRS